MGASTYFAFCGGAVFADATAASFAGTGTSFSGLLVVITAFGACSASGTSAGVAFAAALAAALVLLAFDSALVAAFPKHQEK